MISWSIEQIFPKFLLRDRDGYALCKAAEAMLRYAQEKVEQGLAVLLDVDAMPEWRLDQLAWERNCLYDYAADIESKRYWIREAQKLDQKLGTISAIKQYLQGYFANVQVEEWWQYGGDPFHFRVICSGDVTTESEIWARKAIARAQNVRSVLDGLTIYKENGIAFACRLPVAVAMPVLMCSDNLLCGEE